MALGTKVAFLLAFGLVPAAGLKAVSRTQATPVEKVVQLLEKLSAQIGEEGTKEAAEYDKYACFCKEQADQKIYQIEKSEALIAKLEAEIEKLEADIAELSSAIATLEEEITKLGEEIDEEEKARKEEHEKYLEEDEKMVDAIDAVTAAIEALQASKAEMTDTKLAALPQVRSAVAKVAALSTSSAMKSHAKASSAIALLQDLMGQPEGGKVQAYSYHSNEIIDTLKNLLIEFKQTKKELDVAEIEAKGISEKKVLGLTLEKEFKEKDKAQKEAILEEKTATLHEKTDEKDAETEAMDADIAFKEELQEQCEGAATQFDQRSSTRSSELTAISEALEILKTGVNYDANKKLVGLAAKHTALRRAAPSKQPRAAHAPLSLLQKDAGSAKQAALRRMLDNLGHSADRLRSPVLLALVAKASAQEDHFAKVRDMIKDLIARLEQDALDEADQKSFCDEQMKTAIDNRDSEQLNIEGETATIAKKEAEVKKLTKEIAELSEEIAELNKALNEATELRANEKAANEKTLEEAEAGKEAVEEAIEVLKKFYDAAFVQKNHGKQPALDRDGKATSDYAPKLSYDGDYHGNQDASKGIFGLLEIIVSDFERTITTVTDEESAAQSAFEEFEKATKTSIEEKEKDKETKEGEVVDAEDAIMSAKDAKKTAEDLHSAALKELEKLKPMCVEGEMSYAERVEKREEEIAALKEALKILEEWKS